MLGGSKLRLQNFRPLEEATKDENEDRSERKVGSLSQRSLVLGNVDSSTVLALVCFGGVLGAFLRFENPTLRALLPKIIPLNYWCDEK